MLNYDYHFSILVLVFSFVNYISSFNSVPLNIMIIIFSPPKNR